MNHAKVTIITPPICRSNNIILREKMTYGKQGMRPMCIYANDILQIDACLQYDRVCRVLPTNVFPLGERQRHLGAFTQRQDCRFGCREIHLQRPDCLEV